MFVYLLYVIAVIVGASIGPETDDHEYKSLMVLADRGKTPSLRPCKNVADVLNAVTRRRKDINAMLNHYTGGTVHYGIQYRGNIVEEGLDLDQTAVIDMLKARVGQVLQEFYPAVQTDCVNIQPLFLLNSNNEPTGRWRFDIHVKPFNTVVLMARNNAVAYYRQGSESMPMPADLLTSRLLHG